MPSENMGNTHMIIFKPTENDYVGIPSGNWKTKF